MSNRELAKILIDKVPENKLFYVVSYLQGAVLPDEPNPNKPNEDTLAAMAEVQKMIVAQVNTSPAPHKIFWLPCWRIKQC